MPFLQHKPPSISQQQCEIGVEGVGVPLWPVRAGNAIPPCSRLLAKQACTAFKWRGGWQKAQGTGRCRGKEPLSCREVLVWDLTPLFFINGKMNQQGHMTDKAQICQFEEIWFFSEEIRLIHRIQKDWASHRLMWKADLTLTRATEILKKTCEMQIHFTIKCKFRLETAEAAIPGDNAQKRDKEIPRAKRYRKLKQSQIIKLEVQRANSTPHHSQK